MDDARLQNIKETTIYERKDENIPSKIEENYLIVAAIDFGTTFSGYAYSSRHAFQIDPLKVTMKSWVDPSSSMIYKKTSTCILFTKEKEFSEFGFDAEAKYLDLLLDDDNTDEKAKDWYFFRRFKMALYELQSGDQEVLIEDETGKSLPAMVVFSESLRYLKQSVIDCVSKQLIGIELTDIKWIVTVPAIWSDPAKAFMRKAALEAGIDSKMLTIVLEPEAAATFVKHLPVERRVDGQEGDVFQTFSSGSKYIVVDAGGGTVDITAHEVREDGHVGELIKATGGNWGSTTVDEEYLVFLKKFIGETATTLINLKTPEAFFKASREFEKVKPKINPESGKKVRVRLPYHIREAYKKAHPGKKLKFEESVLMKREKKIDISFNGEYVRMSSKDAKQLFAESITKIIEHLKNIFEQTNGRDISTIILVGGYAGSLVLTEVIKSAFPGMRLIIPHEAAYSVLHGAVIFGHDPSLIRQRRSKYTYGIEVFEIFDPSKHDEKYKYEKNGEFRCDKIFSKLLEVDEMVNVGEYQKEKSYILHSYGRKGNFKLYASSSKNVEQVDDNGCFCIGYILSPGHKFILKESIIVKMRFGETEIEFNAHQPKSQQTSVYHLGY